ncbi:MAG TPA: tetratricopeptide repeat protein, partial [Polyangia bacterium]|nr:tetratricopeptide repeat protein [Polyangia bacterium]
MSETIDQPPPPPSGEDWPARIEELLTEAEAAPSIAERANVLCRVAEIYERRLGDPNGALVTLQAALEQDPSSGRVVQEMERVARSSGCWKELIAITAEVASGLEDPKQSADLWVQIAFWDESGLGLPEEAANAARAALQLAPTHGGALTLLEDLYKRQRNWDRYVEILAHKHQLVTDDPYKLLDAYREVVRYEPQHVGALTGLAQISQETADWDGAADTLRKLISALPPGRDEDRLVARHRLGAILKDRLGDIRGAEEQLVEALATPGGETHGPTMLTLAAIYRERRDWLKARQLLGRAAATAADPAERIRLLVEAAEICANQLDDENQAAEIYGDALLLDPTRTDIIDRLAAVRFKRGDWTGLLPLAEHLVAQLDPALGVPERPADEKARLWYQLARAAEETGDLARATAAYGSSLEAQAAGPQALASRRDLAALTFRLEQWAEAAAAYETLLTSNEGALKRPDMLAALERQGVAYMRAGEPAKAIAPLEKALNLEPRRRVVLEALVEAAKAAGDDDTVVRHTQALLSVIEDRKKKLELLEHVATIHHERRKDPQRAIAAYMAALEIWPDERSIMHRLLELLSETKQWKQSVALLLKLAEQTDAEFRAPYFVAAGNILAEELHAPAEAVDVYERALDADPKDLKSFERVDALVTAARDWKTQERTYRRQIKRMGNDAAPEKRPALLALWAGLGEIYRTRLKDYPSAIAAFEVAADLDPESAERRKILAELYRLNGSATYGKAIAAHRALVSRAASPVEMVPDLKTMLRLFVEMGALDEAHAAASVLVGTGQADHDEATLFQQYRPRGVVRAHGRLTEEFWQRHLYHQDEDRGLSQILATISPAVASARAKPAKDLGLKKKYQRNVLTDQTVVCKALAYGTQVLGLQPPDVYLVPESAGELDVVNVRGGIPGVPTLVIGRKLFEMESDIELAFIVGRTLAAIRPDHLLRWPNFVPTLAELEIAVRGAIRLVDPERPIPPEVTGEVEQYAGHLGRTLPPQVVEQVSALVKRFAAAHGGDAGAVGAVLPRWARGACLTSVRAGLLLAGDLEVAVRLGEAFAAPVGIEPADVV